MKPPSGNRTIRAVGAMSGTSLDGLDLAAVEFRLKDGNWSFKLKDATTIPYPKNWEDALKGAPELSGEAMTELDVKYGKYIGNQVSRFLRKTDFSPDLIASHGHTVFHQPEKGLTLQIGSGAEIANQTRILAVADFRTQDVALKGQGAPLVPVGDRLLFSEYDYCLNLGGFANISFELESERVAFDICPANIVLNALAQRKGFDCDWGGELGKKGELIYQLLDRLNALQFYKNNGPKSLGREWVETIFLPEINKGNHSESDILCTVYEHIAQQVANSVSVSGKMLVTGGGAYNSFLIDRIRAHTKTELVIPDKQIVEFKEAIVFAFLGVLRLLEIPNCLSSVTGAKNDHCSGVIFYP